MRTNHKSSSTPLATTFLLLSLAIVPVSMKATGFSPNLSAVVDAWNQIAGVFGDGYQAAQTTELLALNQSEASQTPAPASDSCCRNTLLATLDSPLVFESEPAQAAVAEEQESNAECKQIPVVAKRLLQTKRVKTAIAHAASETRSEFRVVSLEVQEMTSVAPVVPVEAMRALESEAALRVTNLNLNRALRNLPLPKNVKDVKVLIRAKSLATAAPQISRCGSSSASRPQTKTDWIWSLMPVPSESVPPATTESSEL
jgi:hypothetical protein